MELVASAGVSLFGTDRCIAFLVPLGTDPEAWVDVLPSAEQAPEERHLLFRRLGRSSRLAWECLFIQGANLRLEILDLAASGLNTPDFLRKQCFQVRQLSG